jgi:mono/diheme cytochrome c family protein
VLNRPILFATISMGRLGTEMPAWSKVLSDQEIADVSEFVFRQYIRPTTQSAARGGK